MKILLVCLGNICRSPIAEGLCRAKAAERNLDWEFDSAGIDAWHIGEAPDKRAITVMKRYDLDISKQRARQFQVEDFDKYDFILCMDAENHAALLSQARNEADKAKVNMIMNFVFPGEDISVPDPYNYDDDYESTYQMLDKACEAVIKKLAAKT